MRRGRTSSLALALALFASVAPSAVRTHADAPNDPVMGQDDLDQAAASGNAGYWGDAPGGVAGRPYVKSLTITNGATVTQLVTNGTVETDPPSVAGTPTVIISPTNLCRLGTSEPMCYSSPNRLGMTLAYAKGSSAFGRFLDIPSTPITPTIDSSTVVEAVINMNTWGDKLRWTWMNGNPSYWRIDRLGQADAEITVRFSPATGPSQMCSSRIPVTACDPAEGASANGGTYDPVKVLLANFVLSLDTTAVGPELNGVLFATSNADMGSLESAPVGTPSAALTYGVIGPSELAGTTNEATFKAFVSDSSLLNYFGAPADVVSTDEFRDLALAISRRDGGTGGTPAWTRWSASANGTDGWFLTIGGIRFDGQAVTGSGVGATTLTKTQPAQIKVRPTTAISVTTRRRGTSVAISARGTVAACARNACRVVVRRIGGTTTANSTVLKTVTIGRRSRSVSASTTITLPARQRMSVQLQVRKNGRWVYVASVTRRP